MQKNYSQLISGLLIGAVLTFLIAKQVFQKTPGNNNMPAIPTVRDKQPAVNTGPAADNSRHNTGIPQKVYDVLKYIRANGHAMPGYVGGRVFSNREGILAGNDANGNRIEFHEWDVNPKIEGQNRGTERIITGSDGRAWYTNDHYQSFKEIK